MHTQFFGNYLLSKGYITKEQLFAAMKKKSNKHVKLGTLAIHSGLMTASTLENVITDYRSENEMMDLDMTIENKESVERLFDNFFVISETPVTRLGKMYMELLFNNLIRFVGEDFSPLSSDQCKEFPTDCCVCQDVLGEYSISTYISMDHDTAIKFASRYVNDSFTEYDEYVQASLEDFLNLNNGLFIVNCSNDYGRELSISAPRHVDDGLVSFKDKAYHFQILYTFGTLHFIVEVHKLIEEY